MATKAKTRRKKTTGNSVQHADDSVSRAYDNVFEVFDRPRAAERLAKAELARIVRKRIEEHGWSGVQAAVNLGIAASEVSDLMHGKIARFSQERLERFLNKLDMTVVIMVGPRPKGKRARVDVELVESF